MVRQLNEARKNPRSFIPDVQASNAPISDKNDAVRFLQTVVPCSTTLVLDPILSSISQAWTREQGSRGDTGHGDFISAVTRRGIYRSIGENLSYGLTTNYIPGDDIPPGYIVVQGYRNGILTNFLVSPRNIITNFIIDQGVPNRGHRKNIYSCNFNSIGVSLAPSTQWRIVTGDLYAQDFTSFEQT